MPPSNNIGEDSLAFEANVEMIDISETCHPLLQSSNDLIRAVISRQSKKTVSISG